MDDDEQPAQTANAARPTQGTKETDPELPTGQPQSTKKPGSKKSPPSSPGKGVSARPTTTKEDGGNDPALAGGTASKVRRIRTLLGSLRGKLQGETQEERMQYLMNQLQQIMQTAEEVLAEEKAPPEARDEALLARFQVASMMMQAGLDKEAKEMLNQAAVDLAKADNPQYATLGRVQLFKIHVMDVLKLRPADAEEVLTALDTLLEAGGDVDVITSEVMPLVMELERAGYAKDGVTAVAKIGDHFADSKDPKEALVGKQLQVSGLVGKLRAGEGDPTEVGDQVVAKAKEIVEASQADRGGINLLFQLAYAQEGDFPAVAGKLYDLIEEKYADHSEAEVADKAKELAASGRQRLGLVGKPLTITGVLISGEPFDWSEYQGKVVLVHFWALSSEPSLQDLSSKLRLHGKYQRRGLSLVGINLDEDTKHVEELFEAQKIPWPTLTAEEPAQRGVQHLAAKACGVTQEALPFSVLVGKDGKVVAAGLQGPVLDEAIVKLLTAEDDEPKEKTDDKPKEGESEAEPDGKPDDSK